MPYPLLYHMCFILYHVLTIHQPFDGVAGIFVMRDAHMGKEGDMWHLIVFKETLWFVLA